MMPVLTQSSHSLEYKPYHKNVSSVRTECFVYHYINNTHNSEKHIVRTQ